MLVWRLLTTFGVYCWDARPATTSKSLLIGWLDFKFCLIGVCLTNGNVLSVQTGVAMFWGWVCLSLTTLSTAVKILILTQFPTTPTKLSTSFLILVPKILSSTWFVLPLFSLGVPPTRLATKFLSEGPTFSSSATTPQIFLPKTKLFNNSFN